MCRHAETRQCSTTPGASTGCTPHPLLRWSVLAALVGVLAGLGSALFLLALAWVTSLHSAYPDLLFGLPLAGMVIAWLYAGYGRSAVGGNNLILEHIHEPGEHGVPLRMFPVVLFGVLPLPDFVPVDRALSEALKPVHRWLAYALGSVVLVHIGGALKHHFIDRDGLLRRMLPARV